MITDRLLHIHVFRTAGMMFRNLLMGIPNLCVFESDLHLPYDYMANNAVEKYGLPSIPPAVAFVRNPYTWYVSQWSWICMTNYLGRQGPFKDYMVTLKDQTLAQYSNFMTFSQHWQDIGADKADYIGRFEDLYDDTVRILLAIIPDLVSGDEVREIIQDLPIYHPSLEFVQGGWKRIGLRGEYYDVETLQWVEEWDAALIEKFGYSYES